MSEDIELGALGGRGGTNPLHSGSSYRRRPSVLKRSSFSTAHSKTLESSALAIDSWLFENALAVGDEAGGAEGKAEAEREDRDRGLVRHCVDGSSAVFFISDWQKLWNHFSADPADTFGDSFTFYRDTCYLLCHFQTLRLVCYTVLYSCTIGVVCSIIYPPFSSVLIYLLVINPVFFSLLYLWAYFLYRGPMLSRATVAPNVLAPSQAEREEGLTVDRGTYSSPVVSGVADMGWGGIAKRAVASFFRVAADTIFPCLSPQSSTEAHPLLRYQPSVSEISEDLGIYQLLNVAAKFIVFRGCGNGSRAIYTSIKMCCISCVLLMLLTNGKYIIGRLVDHGLGGCWYDFDPDYPENFCVMLTVLYPSSLFLIIPMGITGFSLLATLLLTTGAGFATMMALQLSGSWVDRFGSLRKLKVPNVVDDGDEDNEKGTENLFASLVARDAAESYLFQQAFMHQLGQKFNGILCAQVIVSFAILIVSIISTMMADNPEEIFMGHSVVEFLAQVVWINMMYAFPIWCVAHSNLAIDRLKNTVIKSGIGDFSILGGREEWIVFMDRNPCFWRVFGFPFTYNTLGIALASTIGPILYLVLPTQWATVLNGSADGSE